ncbi:MAG TPA: hypothetical protein VNS58_22600 [Puia sp.]|nr:hypothetical protein [Puia sp.]
MKRVLYQLALPLLLLSGGYPFPKDAAAQSLSFTAPRILLPDAGTDKAIDITNFKGGYFVTWKEPGKPGRVHVCYLGRHYDTSYSHPEGIIEQEHTAFAPVLRVLNDRLYLFWIGGDGTLKYILNRSDTAFDLTEIHTLSFANQSKLALGITSAAIGGKVLLASHAADKQHLVYALLEPGEDGLFPACPLLLVKAGSSADYPFVVNLNDTVARFCWRGYKEQGVYCTDYNIRTNTWKASLPLGPAKSGAAPAVYQVWNQSRLFYIWKGPDKDKRIYYTTGGSSVIPEKQTALPGYFTTNDPVSICIVDENNFALAYTGENKKLYLSYFSNYNPASWMKDLLLPSKGGYTLRDIVVPGSHDAGMSVLSGAGGSQSGTINDCNTLTQTLPVAGQLNAGIRMFDLRVGRYRDTLYTKHCSSDCMADAIGGGYGEKLQTLLDAIRNFLRKNKGEVVLLTFSHFCERETPVNKLADQILNGLGKDLVYKRDSREIDAVPLKELAGKVIITFEHYSRPDGLIDSCTIGDKSGAFVNFRREYAATDQIGKFLARQESFFHTLAEGTNKNDLVRLDWQLTQSSDEAAMICNDFQDEKTNALVNGAMLLTNVIRKHQSIVNLSLDGNKYLPVKLNEWIGKGLVNSRNKPNIIYVDVAGEWVTDYCIDLNKTSLYQK